MPNDVLSDADVGIGLELSDLDVGLAKPIDLSKSYAQPGQLDAQGNKPYAGYLSAGPFSPYNSENMQEAVNLYKSLGDPAIAIPRIRGTSTLGKLAAAPVNVAAGLAEGFESPLGLAATAVGGPVVKGLFAGLAAKEAGRALGEASVTKDPQQLAEGVLGAGLAPWMALHGTLGERVPPVIADQRIAPSPDISQVVEQSIQETPNAKDQIKGTSGVPVEQQGVTPDRPAEVQAQEGTAQRPSESVNPLPQSAQVPQEIAPPSAPTPGVRQQVPSDVAAKGEGVAAPSPAPANVESGTVEPVSQGRGTIGEVEMGAAGIKEIPETGAGGEIYGTSQAAREARAKAGQVEPVQPGVGINPYQANARGIELLDKGFDAPKALENFEKTDAVSPDDAMAIGAYGERLAADARQKELLGTESPEYKEAFKALSDWDKRSKGVATVAHKLMVAHQGVTDLDTGSFTAFRRAFNDVVGKDFDPRQEKTAKVITGESQKVTKAATGGVSDFVKTMDDAVARGVPEQRAFDAANKTVREAAAASAEAENKARVAQAARDKAVADIQAKPENKALTAARDVARKSAIRLADAENKARVATTAAEKRVAQVQVDAERRALDAANKVVREHAVSIADEATKKRIEEAQRNQDLADIESKRTKAALTAATDQARRAAIAASKLETKKRIDQANLAKTVWEHIKDKYLSKGINDPGVVFAGTATDLGMTPTRVREILSQPQNARRMMNEMYKKLADQRRVVNAAKMWLEEQKTPGIVRFVSNIPKVFFVAKIFGHGTALHVTHAPTMPVNPYVASIWWKSFFKQWPFAYKPGYAEAIIRDTLNDPNYITARRFGLDSDFTSASGDYQAATSKFKGVMRTLAGTKGTDGLKVLRQQTFNKFWDDAPSTLKDADYGKKLAVSVNHMTGSMAGTTKTPQSLSWILFAPKLEGSRWGYAFGDSIKTGTTLARWKDATPAEKAIARSDIKQKASVVGTYFALLTANQGLLTAAGSKQSVNFTDPTKSDWLSFKILGHKVGILGPMLGEVRFLANVIKTGQEARTKKQARFTRTDDQRRNLLDYARGKLSPFAGTVADVGLTQSDYSGRPLPWSTDRVPSYLKKHGEGRYTYPEYAASQLPIPFEEAAKETWKAQGVDDATINKWLKALAVGSAAMTGARVSKDYNVK